MSSNGTAIFSPCGRYRYRLTRQWHTGEPALCLWWMLNPSKAGADIGDLTVAKTCGFSQRWGFGGEIIVNMYGLVSTNPKIMLTDHDPVGPENDAYLLSAMALPNVARIVCAWGNLPWGDKDGPHWRRVDGWARRLKSDPRTVCLGRTALGEPRHPSRLGYATEVEPFRVSMGNPPRVVGAGGVVGWGDPKELNATTREAEMRLRLPRVPIDVDGDPIHEIEIRKRYCAHREPLASGFCPDCEQMVNLLPVSEKSPLHECSICRRRHGREVTHACE